MSILRPTYPRTIRFNGGELVVHRQYDPATDGMKFLVELKHAGKSYHNVFAGSAYTLDIEDGLLNEVHQWVSVIQRLLPEK